MELISRYFSMPTGSFFLFGPRGTGKSTWLRRNFPDSLYIDLLDPISYRAYLSRPERLGEVVKGNPRTATVIIDEIQKVPGLLDVVHQLIEDKTSRRLQFILTGSSARKLKRSGADLLAGRLVQKTLHPFLASELGCEFDLARNMELGMLPLVLGADDSRETLDSYVSLYLREEVQDEGLVRNAGNFARFIEAISFSHGSILNTSEVARQCQVSRKTTEGFVEILEDLLLGFRLQAFTRRARRKLIHHPKFYFMDCGVFRSVRPTGPLDSPEEIGGALLEGLIAQHLRAWIAYSEGRNELYFWRTRAGSEVDFIVYGANTFIAIEVKSSKSVYRKDVKPLRAFLEDYPQAKGCLLYGGLERLEINGILCLPCSEFLEKLVPNSPLPIV